MTIAYKAGQVVLTNGSAVVTGVGTAWATSLIAGGIVAAQADGNPLPIETVDSDTQITAAIAWTGASGTYNYALVRDTSYLQQLNVNSNALARLIAELDAGTVFKYDASGDLAGRATYDERTKGFSYLVSLGVSQPALYVKASATSGDWGGPFAYGTGPVGPMGPAGLANPRGTYSAATIYARNDVVLYNGSSFVALQVTTGHAPPTLPATSNAYWQLTSPKGADGTGTGDVLGPEGAVIGNFAVYETTTGKKLKALTPAEALAAMGGASFVQNLTFYSTLTLEQSEASGKAIAAGPDGNGVYDGFGQLTYVDVAGASNLDSSTSGELKPTINTAVEGRTTTTGISSAEGFTIVDRGYALTNGRTVTKLGMYSLAARTVTLKILKRVSAGTYDVVASQSFNHPGGGWADMTLTTPYLIPATGSFYVGAYYAVAGAVEVNTAFARSWYTGAATGTSVAFTEEASGSAHATRATEVIGVGSLIVASVGLPLSAAPDWGMIFVFAKQNDAVLNTSLIFELSRDGANYTAAAVTKAFNRPDGSAVLKSGLIDLSALTSGTTAKWRVKTNSGKSPTILAVGVIMGVVA